MEGSRIIFNARNSTTGLLLTTIRIHFTNYTIPAVGFLSTLSWDMCKLVVDISRDSCVYKEIVKFIDVFQYLHDKKNMNKI